VEGNPFSQVFTLVFEDRADRKLMTVSTQGQVANVRDQHHRQMSDRS
jgi:hypothetical protein